MDSTGFGDKQPWFYDFMAEWLWKSYSTSFSLHWTICKMAWLHHRFTQLLQRLNTVPGTFCGPSRVYKASWWWVICSTMNETINEWIYSLQYCNVLNQGLAGKLFLQGAREQIMLGFVGHMVLVTTSTLLCSRNQQQTIKEWEWLCTNKTLFAKTGKGLDLACRPQLPDPCSNDKPDWLSK